MIKPITNTAYLVCENSGAPIADFAVSHSMIAVLQKVSLLAGYQFYQCDLSPNYVNFVNYQHLHVSREHMKRGMQDCIANHYAEIFLHSIPAGQGQTNLAAIVLGAGLKCKMSNVPLVNAAYRFCLTHCTPINEVPDESLNMLGEWCSTLALAQQSALAIIAGM